MVRTLDGDSRPIDNLFASEWRLGLPSFDDLTPLSQSLISPGLASAFGIMPTTCSTIFPREPASKIEALQLFPEKSESEGSRVRRRPDSEDPDGGSDECNSCGDESGSSARAAKRPRLVWTPELHKRFVDVIEQLGVDKAVPKTIMEMMNVEGLTRENVASHLQKYRMYLKKAEVVPSEADSDPVPVSSPASQRRGSSAFDCGSGGFGPILPSGLQFNSVAMMPLPLPAMVGGLGVSFGCGGGPLGVAPATGGSGDGGYYGMESAGFNAPMLWNRRGS